jgi:SpoIIAA-like
LTPSKNLLGENSLVIAFCREVTGLLVVKIQDHFWPEDLERAIPMIHAAAHNRLDELLLLVELSSECEGSGCEIIKEILEPADLPPKRLFRLALLSRTSQQEKVNTLLKQKFNGEIRVFAPDRKREAESWLLTLQTPGSPPVLA